MLQCIPQQPPRAGLEYLCHLFEIRDKAKHIPYTEEEMALLWANVGKYPDIDLILIQCYSGWRPRELCYLRRDDVNLNARTFTGGLKTNAGKNRIVPIHPRIFDLVQARYQKSVELGSPYLCSYFAKGKVRQVRYTRYWMHYQNILTALNLNPEHKPHDGRKHFITMAKKYDMDEYAIKRIVGHYIKDLAERIYTERNIEWLQNEIKKIP